MRLKTKLSGFDGSRSYERGTELEGPSEHNLRLLFNGAAEPLDDEAKNFVESALKLEGISYSDHRLFNRSLHESVAQAGKEDEQRLAIEEEAKTRMVAEGGVAPAEH